MLFNNWWYDNKLWRRQKNRDRDNSGLVSGMLLYAKTDEELTPDFDYIISGNRIGVKTLDLNRDFENIKNQLNSIICGYL